ncbi:hypothetical protein P8452_50787 [Trifolium repens]|nr:hypothetical protein P8452_50787 [Trifolium repens]
MRDKDKQMITNKDGSVVDFIFVMIYLLKSNGNTRINLKTEMPFPAAINLIKENQHETLAFVIKSDYFYFTI